MKTIYVYADTTKFTYLLCADCQIMAKRAGFSIALFQKTDKQKASEVSGKINEWIASMQSVKESDSKFGIQNKYGSCTYSRFLNALELFRAACDTYPDAIVYVI